MYVIGGHRAAKKRDRRVENANLRTRIYRAYVTLGHSSLYPTGVPESGQSEQRPTVIATDAKDGTHNDASSLSHDPENKTGRRNSAERGRDARNEIFRASACRLRVSNKLERGEEERG